LEDMYLRLLDIPLIRDSLKDRLKDQQARDARFQLPTEIERLTRLIRDFEELSAEWDYRLTPIIEQCPSCKGPLADCRNGTCAECGDSGCPVLENPVE
jgi:hypothetical protein